MIWDKESIYDEQIYPLMSKIIGICKGHKIPMVAQFQIANSEELGARFCTTTLPFDGVACDRIKKMAQFAHPSRPVVLAETVSTDADGITRVAIRQV